MELARVTHSKGLEVLLPAKQTEGLFSLLREESAGVRKRQRPQARRLVE